MPLRGRRGYTARPEHSRGEKNSPSGLHQWQAYWRLRRYSHPSSDHPPHSDPIENPLPPPPPPPFFFFKFFISNFLHHSDTVEAYENGSLAKLLGVESRDDDLWIKQLLPRPSLVHQSTSRPLQTVWLVEENLGTVRLSVISRLLLANIEWLT